MWTFVKVLDKIWPTFIHFSRHEWKLAKFSLYLINFLSHFSNIHNFQTCTKFNEIQQNFTKVMKFHQSWRNFMVYYFNFVQFQFVLLNYTFAFGAFKSWPQNFGLIQTDSKFWNIWLGDGKSWKSQYQSYLQC